jgi:16S rRNA (guanine527-N7)-methyltransferase
MISRDIENGLKQPIADLGLSGITPKQLELLAMYCQLLWEWNEKVNLTRHSTPELFVKRDLLDSWHVAKLLKPNEEVLDMGTGGGVPGVLVAILRPDVEVSLCDSVGKKARIVDDIVRKLDLSVPVYGQGVQKVLEDFTFDTVIARAVGPLPRLCGWFENDWHKIGRLLAIKGPQWIAERGEARHRGLLKGIELRKVDSYPMPDTHSQSVILQLRRPKPGEAMVAEGGDGDDAE